MSLTAQNIVDSVSQDIRNLLSNTAPEANILLDYVDRVHKDSLHNSIYQFLNQLQVTIATVAATSNYALGVSLRRILAVYDRTRDRALLPMDTLTNVPQREKVIDVTQIPAPLESSYITRVARHTALQSGQPEFYRHIGAATMYLFPTPQQVLSLDVFYEGQVATIAALSTTLIVPEDGKDMLVAGVNYLASQYLQRTEDMQVWSAIYEKLKRGEGLI